MDLKDTFNEKKSIEDYNYNDKEFSP